MSGSTWIRALPEVLVGERGRVEYANLKGTELCDNVDCGLIAS
jgi:hypothetical protein